MAILYYEKARRFMPQDADLKANLSFVTEEVEEGKSTVDLLLSFLSSPLLSGKSLFIPQ